MRYKTQGVCSREISFEVKDNKLTNVQFVGGCSGNTQGLSRLIEGMDIGHHKAGRHPLRPQAHILSGSVSQGFEAV